MRINQLVVMLICRNAVVQMIEIFRREICIYVKEFWGVGWGLLVVCVSANGGEGEEWCDLMLHCCMRGVRGFFFIVETLPL